MAWVVERFGRFDKVLDPGLQFLLPLVHRVSYTFSLKEEAISVPSQTAITRDNVSISIDAVLYVKVSLTLPLTLTLPHTPRLPPPYPHTHPKPPSTLPSTTR